MDPLTEHACEAAATGRARRSTATNVATVRRCAPTDRLQLDQLREELQRGVRLTQHAAQQDGDDSSEAENDMDRAYHARRLRSSPVFADDEAENAEIAAFLGLSISTDNQDIPNHASSFSGGSRTRMVPCSPPVPIPPKHRLRRNSVATTTTARVPSGSTLLPSHDHQYSRTQCEARLWDEYWNYKLSLESRESFEASNNPRDGRESPLPGSKSTPTSTRQDHSTKRRTTSEASTDDTARDSSDDLDGVAGEVDVFDMDDL